MVERYDLIVVGSGAGLNVASRAVYEGMKVALVEHGAMGGTCLNTGCIPSKILIYPADVVRILQDALAVGVVGQITSINFPLIMDRMRALVQEERREMEEEAKTTPNFRWYRHTGEFVSDYTLKAGEDLITAPKIVIASGARALIPPIPGLKEAGFLDNESVFQIDRPPKSLVILGGGYIGCEFAHFFSAIGSEVTLVGRNPKLLPSEDPDISQRFLQSFSRYVKVHPGTEVVKVERREGQKVVHAKDRQGGRSYSFEAEEILVAAGRRSNADLLKPEATGVETDRMGWIKVDDYLETTKPGIWALGDAIGKHMFRHTANYEATVVWNNAFTDQKEKVDFHAVPHAVFSHPQVASVGLTEPQAFAEGYELLVGKASYTDTAKGYAMGEEEGLAKAIVDSKTGRILGFHVVGSSAPELVQQITYLMNAEGGTYAPLARSQVIHPTISEVVIRAFGNLERVRHGE